MSTSRPRFSVTVSEEMYEQINEFQHANKLSTQTKAIAQLLQLGIDALTNTKSENDVKKQHTPIAEDEGMKMYSRLDREDKAVIRGEMKCMLRSPKYGTTIPVAARGGGVSEVKLTPEQAAEAQRIIDEKFPELSGDAELPEF